MALGLKTLHVGVEDADAIDVAFFRVAAQQLLTHADAQHGLAQRTDDIVQPASLQVLHGTTGFALSGKQHVVGTLQLLGIVRQQRLHTQPSQCVHHRVDVSSVIFYDCYVHFFFLLISHPFGRGWGWA